MSYLENHSNLIALEAGGRVTLKRRGRTLWFASNQMLGVGMLRIGKNLLS